MRKRDGRHPWITDSQMGALRRAIGEAHRRYTRRINFREKWRGYLWQGRFASLSWMSLCLDFPLCRTASRKQVYYWK